MQTALKIHMMESRIKETLNQRAYDFKVKRHIKHFLARRAFLNFKLLPQTNRLIERLRAQADTFWKLQLRNSVLAKLRFNSEQRVNQRNLNRVSSLYLSKSCASDLFNKLKYHCETNKYYRSSKTFDSRRLHFQRYLLQLKQYKCWKHWQSRQSNKALAFNQVCLRNKAFHSFRQHNVDSRFLKRRLASIRARALTYQNQVRTVNAYTGLKRYVFVKKLKQTVAKKTESHYCRQLLSKYYNCIKNKHKIWATIFVAKQKQYFKLKYKMICYESIKINYFNNIKNKYLFNKINKRYSKDLKSRTFDKMYQSFNKIMINNNKLIRISNKLGKNMLSNSLKQILEHYKLTNGLKTIKGNIKRVNTQLLFNNFKEFKVKAIQRTQQNEIAYSAYRTSLNTKMMASFVKYYRGQSESNRNNQIARKFRYFYCLTVYFNAVAANHQSTSTYARFKTLQADTFRRKATQGFKKLQSNCKTRQKVKQHFLKKKERKNIIMLRNLYQGLKSHWIFMCRDSEVLVANRIDKLRKMNLVRNLYTRSMHSKIKSAIVRKKQIELNRIHLYNSFNSCKNKIVNKMNNNMTLKNKYATLSKYFKYSHSVSFLNNLRAVRNASVSEKINRNSAAMLYKNSLQTKSFESLCSYLYFHKKDLIDNHKSLGLFKRKMLKQGLRGFTMWTRSQRIKKQTYSNLRIERKDILATNFIHNLLKYHRELGDQENLHLLQPKSRMDLEDKSLSNIPKNKSNKYNKDQERDIYTEEENDSKPLYSWNREIKDYLKLQHVTGGLDKYHMQTTDTERDRDQINIHANANGYALYKDKNELSRERQIASMNLQTGRSIESKSYSNNAKTKTQTQRKQPKTFDELQY